ncbi:MAG TPA: isocitrate/isopropylmalate family dehydrogenase [Gemmataceae bacterium]|nr:isocitrate/isopropylmalate family dehydrogenase [Gemmataceae bacterium]
MAQPVVFIQGGGIGVDQEIAVRRILAAAGVELDWRVFPAGQAALDQGQAPISRDLLEAVREMGVALKTKLLHPPHPDENYTIHFRRDLGLFASVRPIRNLDGIKARFENLDILLIREITEDLYTAIEHEIVPGVVQSLKVVTGTASLRFFRFAFDLARKAGRKTVHCIHKANILKLADGLFLESFRRAAAGFPEIQPKEMIVDNACMQLASKPQQFDVVVAGNLYGDLLSDLGAGLIGGISATSAVNYGDGVCVYEAIHGGPRDLIGADRANPLPVLMPALEMLTDLGHGPAAKRIRAAVESVLNAKKVLTFDLGGDAGTQAMAEAIIAALQ